MPNNSQQVALHTWLLLVPLLLLVMGGVNGLASWQLTVEWQPAWVSVPIMLLVGAGLLATLLGRTKMAQCCGALLLPFGLFAPLLTWLPPGVMAAVLPQHTSLSPASSIAVLIASICLMAGIGSARGRLTWWLGGVGIVLVGGLSIVAGLRSDLLWPSPWGTAFATPFTALPALLTGTAMVLMARNPTVSPVLSRGVVVALAGGVLSSGLVWYGLAWQQYDARQQHAAELLTNFKISAERVVDRQQRELQRMASRWAEFGGLPPPTFRRVEADAYFRDVPSLVSLYWQEGDSERFQWGREKDASFQLLNWLERHDWLVDWLAVGGGYPRWVLPDAARPELAMVTVPLPQPVQGRLVAVLDLRRLLEQEIHSLATPLALSVRRQGNLMVANQAIGEMTTELQQGFLVLPGGATLSVKVQGDGPFAMSSLGEAIPLGVGVAGLVLSYLLAFSLAMADLSRRRSLA
ncbi:MAG: hypothetical protein ACRC3F_06160, partial [Billgrantia desiderata]